MPKNNRQYSVDYEKLFDTTRHVPNGGNLVEPAECESRINVRNLHGNLKVP